MKSKPLLLALLGMAVFAGPSLAAEYRVSSAEDVASVSGDLRPGDVVLMADGSWKDQTIRLQAKGTAEQPIMLRAQTPGKVVLTGASSLTVDGEYIVISGLCLKDGRAAGDAIRILGQHCRLTDTAITDGTYKFFVHFFGQHNRMDHCYLAGKTSEGPTLQIEAEQPNHHRIDHNHFGPRPPLGQNGGETIRVGYSHQSMNTSGTLVEHNLFDRCDGELEIISSKSCENVYRFNTFLDCAGMLTLRHGNRCRVEGNFFLGHHKKGSGGIRVIGEDHVIINNYIDGVSQGGFWITCGIPVSPLNGYYRARNCLIAFNTVLDSRGPYIELDAGFGTSRRSLRPEKITIANNLFWVPEGGTLLKGTAGEEYRWTGNIAWPDAGERTGIRVADPKLQRVKDGLWRPAADSPARGGAEESLPDIKTDIDGQVRQGRWDVGCDQASDAPVTNRPLTAAEVGPLWMGDTAVNFERGHRMVAEE